PSSPFGWLLTSGAWELPSVMLLNGDCPESLKKEERAPELPRENGLDEAEPGEETTGQEVIVIQDTGFSVKILAPGIEPFSLQVSPQEMVQEIHQVLMDREDTCHRTCFSLHLDGNMLDHFSELRSVEGLQEGSVLRVVEEPYTVREARIHVRHVRDLLKSLDPSDAFNGVDCNSLSFLSVFTDGDLGDSGKRKKGLEMDPIDCTPPEYILPGSRERPLCPLQPQNRDWKPLQCLKVLTMSGWNPPPGNRKMHGDLMYLFVITAEDRQVSITASTRGFYLNQSTAYHFNPKPASPRFLSHSLVELLNQISPTFKKNFAVLQKKRVQRHPFERIATPFQVYSWTAPQAEHAMDCVRAEDAYTSRLGYEEHIPGQTRDWNEELQTTRELPRKNLPERLLRERAIFKVHSDFTAAATRGAMAVIDGNVMAINPSEETKMQMFIWNNIFFSLGFDVRDHYKDFGGDVAAYVAPTNDLNGVRTYNAVDVEGLYTLGTVVVDYRGYRVTAQSIIPGILERDQEQSVIYGSIDFGKTVMSHPRYLELLERTSRPLKILRHRVLNDRDEEVELCSSVECKGIIGNDGRHYILDLLRTFPPDLNFLPVPGEGLPEECTRAGFPRAHRHKLCCLRQELVDAFVEPSPRTTGQVGLLGMRGGPSPASVPAAGAGGRRGCGKPDPAHGRPARVSERSWGRLGVAQLVEGSCLPAGRVSTADPRSREVIRNACKAVGSISSTAFDVRFNPDIFSPGVRFPESCQEEVRDQKQLLKDAAAFLLSCQIPGLVKDCIEHAVLPMDGATLAEVMRQRGINMRYLGKVLDLVLRSPAREQLDHIYVSDARVPQTPSQGVELSGLSAAISHFLNCFLSSYPNPVAHLPADELISKKRNRRRRNRPPGAADNTAWAVMTPQELWKNICQEAKNYFDFSLEWCVSSAGALGPQHEGLWGPRPVVEDVLNIFPVVKHVNPKASDAFHFFQSGQAKVQQGFLKEGCELINEALNLFNNVYGAMHVEICACLRLLARLHYIMGDYAEALSNQQKAVLMSERVMGIEHPNTIQEYNNIGLVLHGVMEYDLSLRFLENALAVSTKYHGPKSLKVALRGGRGIRRSAFHLTPEEVSLNFVSSESWACLSFTAPSMASVLEQLNVINGILFIPLSQKDLENLKAEVARRQQLQEASRNREKAEEPMATEPEPAGAPEDSASQPQAAKDPSSPSLQG
uniref:Clustered mitochondria protein homolog n=1 Tax=Ursus maritimus TaxID=29073 RepID=A0A452TVL0_URSMA